MATKEKRKTWKKWAGEETIQFGPGLGLLIEIAQNLMSKEPREIVISFGTTKKGYRQIPVKEVQVLFKKGRVDVFGLSHLPGYEHLNNRPVRILNYYPDRRFAEKLEVFE